MARNSALAFAQMFKEVAQRESSRVSYHVEAGNRFSIRATGRGQIPYDTGRTQNSIFIIQLSPTECTVRFNGQETPYAVYLQYCENVGATDIPNSHRYFLQRFTRGDFVNELRKKFKVVEIQ